MAHGMRDVILADDGDPERGEPGSRARGDPHRAPPIARPAATSDGDGEPATRLRRRWALVGALLLAVALVAALVADGVTDRRRAARLADVAGVLEPVSSPLRVLWSQPGGWNHPAVHGPDVMVSLFEDAGADFRLVTNDIVTGEQRWDVAVPGLRLYDDLSCRAHGADVTGVSTHVFCRQLQQAGPGRRSASASSSPDQARWSRSAPMCW